MLRGEQLFRTDRVVGLITRICFAAKVLSQDARSRAPDGAYSASIKFEAVTAEERRAAAKIQAKHDAWPAFVSHWVPGRARCDQPPAVKRLVETLIKALHLLPIIPQVCCQVAAATCNCGDFAPDAWCKHVAAIGFQIIRSCELDPLYPFFLRQLNMDSMMLSVVPPPMPAAPPPKRARCGETIDLVSDDEVEELAVSSEVGSTAEHAICCE